MKTVWYIKLPAEWKDIFADMAKDAGYTERGAAAREVRRLIKAYLIKEGLVE